MSQRRLNSVKDCLRDCVKSALMEGSNSDNCCQHFHVNFCPAVFSPTCSPVACWCWPCSRYSDGSYTHHEPLTPQPLPLRCFVASRLHPSRWVERLRMVRGAAAALDPGVRPHTGPTLMSCSCFQIQPLILSRFLKKKKKKSLCCRFSFEPSVPRGHLGPAAVLIYLI